MLIKVHNLVSTSQAYRVWCEPQARKVAICFGSVEECEGTRPGRLDNLPGEAPTA